MTEFHYCWEWRLRSSPERLWPLGADTNRFNRDARVPELELGEVRRGGRRRLRLVHSATWQRHGTGAGPSGSRSAYTQAHALL